MISERGEHNETEADRRLVNQLSGVNENEGERGGQASRQKVTGAGKLRGRGAVSQEKKMDLNCRVGIREFLLLSKCPPSYLRLPFFATELQDQRYDISQILLKMLYPSKMVSDDIR